MGHEDIPCEKPRAENTAETASKKHDQVMQEKPTNVVLNQHIPQMWLSTMFVIDSHSF